MAVFVCPGKDKVICKSGILAIFWVLWLERNASIFDWVIMGFGFTRNRIAYGVSLWVSIDKEIKDCIWDLTLHVEQNCIWDLTFDYYR